MDKRRLTLFDKLILFVAIIAAAFLVIGSFAGHFDPRTHAIVAFSGLAYPFLLVFNLIFLVVWLLRKRWIFFCVTLLVIFTGKNTLHATFKFFGNAETAVPETDRLRIMTYNVHNFKEYGGTNTVEVKRKMLNVIKDQKPDIICFQEFYTRFKGEFDITDSIKAMLNTPYFYLVPSSENRHEAIGLAIFSKYPIKDRAYVAFETSFGGNGSIYIDIDFKGKPLRIYNIHLRSISFEKQDYNYMDKVTKEIKPDKKSSERILHMLNSAFKKRADHVETMKAELKKCPTPYIIAGDFNDTPASYAVNQLTGQLNNAFIEQGKGLGCTYNGKFPNFQIDYIAATKDMDILTYHVTEAKLSDHFPVRADLRFK